MRVRRIFCASFVMLVGCAGRANSSAGRVANAGAAAVSRDAFAPSYTAYVANEASDLVSRVTFTPGSGVVIERNIAIGEPGRIVGPHGLVTSPDGKSWYVTLSHGIPTGRIAKYSTVADSLYTRVNVGAFPENIAITPDSRYLFVTNSEHRNDEAMSGISVILTASMTEVARPQTCSQPEGGRVNATGTRHYSVCLTNDQLVEIDTHTFQVTHRFSLIPGEERTVAAAARGVGRRVPSGCAPTWVESGRGMYATNVYVACSRNGQILEIDTQLWGVTRRIDATGVPAQITTDPSGSTLFVPLHADSALVMIDIAGKRAPVRVHLSQYGAHGVSITDDGRYAFVTSEGAGSAKGTVDVIDVARMRAVASVELAYSPGAIDLLPIHPGTRR